MITSLRFSRRNPVILGNKIGGKAMAQFFLAQLSSLVINLKHLTVASRSGKSDRPFSGVT
jgi:hypothetical protein